jgi:hypothetical protein
VTDRHPIFALSDRWVEQRSALRPVLARLLDSSAMGLGLLQARMSDAPALPPARRCPEAR